MAVVIATFPSGLIGEFRGMKAKDFDAFVRAKSLAGFNSLVNSCCSGVSDPGPYNIPEGAKFDWVNALLGDKFYALLQIYRATYGKLYKFETKCTNPVCANKLNASIDLTAMTVRPLPEESRRVFVSGGNVFDGRVPAEESSYGQDINFKFRLATGVTELEHSRAKKRAIREVTTAFLSRLISVDGVGAGQLEEWAEDIDMSDYNAMLDVMDAHDCGVDTEVEVACPHCGNTMAMPLPLDQSFFKPPKKT